MPAVQGELAGPGAHTYTHAGFVLDALEQAVHCRRPAKAVGLVIIATVGLNIRPSDIPRGWALPASKPRSAASTIHTTILGPRRSMGCSRLRSSTVAAHGAASRPWNTPIWNGATGSSNRRPL